MTNQIRNPKPESDPRQCAHNDPKNFVDVHCDRQGWIKTISRQCRGFIGYRDAVKMKNTNCNLQIDL